MSCNNSRYERMIKNTYMAHGVLFTDSFIMVSILYYVLATERNDSIQSGMVCEPEDIVIDQVVESTCVIL